MDKKIKLGYCPTMTPYVESFKREIEDHEIVPMQGAAIVMNKLLAGEICFISSTTIDYISN